MQNKSIFIEKNDQLSEFLKTLSPISVIGVDTEFIRQNTYWPILCLIQISDGIRTAVVDATSKKINLKPIFNIMQDISKKKIFHAAEQDLQILSSEGGPIRNIFDTQIASMFVGHKAQISYNELVKNVIGANVTKTEQNSAWNKRPLSVSQLNYAARDVIYLPKLFRHLNNLIETKNFNSWIEEEMNRLEQSSKRHYDPMKAWEKIRLPHTSEPTKHIIKQVAYWRELMAQHHNVPRTWIFDNNVVKHIAKNPRTIRIYAKELLKHSRYVTYENFNDLIKFVEKLPLLEKPQLPPINDKKTVRSEKNIIKSLKSLLNNECETYGISPHLVANRLELEKMANGNGRIRASYGWRFEVFGKKAIRLINSA